MAKQADEIGESTITLAADDDSKSERRFYARLGGVLLLAVLACLVWLIVGAMSCFRRRLFRSSTRTHRSGLIACPLRSRPNASAV